jgi:hypothetical protein
MNRILQTLCATLLLMGCSESAPTETVDESAAVRACYDGYFTALREGKGEVAAELVDSRTLAHYERMLDLARSADSATVAALEPMDKLTVLAMRLQNSAPDLKAMDVRTALSRSISGGIMASEAPEGLDLGTVTVNGEEAKAPLKLHGFPTPASFTFRRENGAWRIDLTSLFDLSRMAFQHMAGSSGKEGNAFMMQVLEENTGTPVPSTVWHPVP